MAKEEKQAFDVDVAEYELAEIGIEVKYNKVSNIIDVIDHNNILNDSDNPLTALEDYLNANYKEPYKFVSRDNVAGVIRLLADRHNYHPVQEMINPYIEKVGNYDAIKEISDDILYIDKDDELSRTYVRKFFRQVIAMSKNTSKTQPFGNDGIMVLVGGGKQGNGKSLFVQRMALGYFGEITFQKNIDETDLYSLLNSVFVGEIPEIEHSLRPYNKEFFKKMITSPLDKYRAKYGRQYEQHNRTSSLIATCNTETFLLDRTGNRRFWCIKCDKSLNLERLANMNDDIFLKAYAQAYKELEKYGMQSFRLTEREKELTEMRNINFMAVNPELSQIIYSLLDLVDVSHFTINDLKEQSNELAGMSSMLIGKELSKMPNIKAKRTRDERFYYLEGGKNNAG